MHDSSPLPPIARRYYFNYSSGMAYWYPPSGWASGDTFVSTIDTVLELNGVSHVSFSGFTVAGGKRTAIFGAGVTGVSLVGIAVVAAGGDAISLSGTQNIVVNCTVLDAGCRGLAISGGDFQTLSPGGNVVDGNTFHGFSRFMRTYTPGIAFYSVGDLFRGNIVASAPHAGMLGSGNNCLFSGNVFDTLCYEVSDSGAWYSGASGIGECIFLFVSLVARGFAWVR